MRWFPLFLATMDWTISKRARHVMCLMWMSGSLGDARYVR